MPRTAVTPTTLSANSSIAAPSGASVDMTNGNIVSFTTNTVPAGPNADKLLLVFTHTTGSAKHVVIRSGVGGGAAVGPAFRQGIGAVTAATLVPAGDTAQAGDLSINVTSSTTVWIGPLEPAKYAQLDGSIYIDYESGTTGGTIFAVLMPERF